MNKDNLKLTILVDGKPVYFGAPVFYSQKTDGDGISLIMSTEIGPATAKQKIEIQIKNPTYVEPTSDASAGDTPRGSDK
jgi:hypothetical protein